MTNKTATKIEGAVVVRAQHTLTSGVQALVVDCADYDAYQRLPQGVEFEGKRYGLSGWNSDMGCAYYRTDMRLAQRA